MKAIEFKFKFFISSLFWLGIFLLFSGTNSAQLNYDSLQREIESAESDTTKIRLLNEFAVSSHRENFGNSILLLDKALAISIRIIDNRKIGETYLNKGLVYLKVNLDSSKKFLDKAAEYFIDLNDKKKLASYYSLLGDWSQEQKFYNQTIANYSKAIQLFNDVGYSIGEILVYNKIGQSYYSLDDFSNASIYYFRALELAEKMKDEQQIGNSYINISNVLNAEQEYNNAIVYLRKSLSIFEISANQYNIGVCYNNIAANYIYQDSLDLALNYLGKALQIYIKLGDNKGQAACYLNMGIVSSKNEALEQSIVYFNSSLRIAEILNDQFRIANCLANMTIVFLKKQDYIKVKELSKRGLTIANDIKALSIQRIFYENLSSTFDSLQDYKNAYYNYKLLKQVDDSLFNAEKQKQVFELEAKYQGEKKENDINRLTEENSIKAIQLEKNRNFLIFLVVMSFLVLVLLIVFYRLYKLKFKTSELLSNKNNELESLNKNLQQSEQALKKLNATKDKFFTIIAHDIKNPLSAYRAITKMLTESYYQLSETEKISYISRIYNSSENLYKLFQNLLLWSTSQSGTIKYLPKEIDLGILAFKAVSLLQENANNKNIEIDLKVESDTFAYCDSNMISTVFINLLSNAIKFSKPNTTIEISYIELPNSIQISIQDSGIGIAAEHLSKLFKVEFDHKTIGNAPEKGTGIGLILCQEFILRNGGEIWVESELNQGSTFHFTVPKIELN